MIVLDANILIRAVLGRRVRQLLETYSPQSIRFFAPDVAFDDARKYLPLILKKRGKSDHDVSASVDYLEQIVERVDAETYGVFEDQARQRLHGRDEEDWPVLATALAWDVAFGVRTWTSLELGLRSGPPTVLRSSSRPSSKQKSRR